MSSSHGGRRRPLTRASSASEDQALNQIAREAESRLAAKRAARAEARSIRLKELEKEHKEAQEELDKQQQGTSDDQVVSNKKLGVSRSVSIGGISSRAKEEVAEMNGPAVPEKVLKSMQENLHQMEEKYRKAMVSIAQLDNEKQALLYQVDCLKDRLAEEEEVCSELKSENQQQTRESERLKKRIKEQGEEIEKLREALELRDNFLSEKGLSLYEETEPHEDDECDSPSLSQIKDALKLAVPDDSSSVLDRSSVSGTRSRSGSRRPSLSDEKDVLVNQIKTLQEQVATLRRADVDPPQTITADLEELRREFSRQINDFKIKQQKAEQDNARLEGLVMRLESQVKRYKTQAEASEATEDSLKAEKRKLQRELRKAQDEKGELETVNDHLQKRLEKLKSKRKDEG